jgi:hypothetical protein
MLPQGAHRQLSEQLLSVPLHALRDVVNLCRQVSEAQQLGVTLE